MSLNLHPRLAQSAGGPAFTDDLGAIARNYRHVSQAAGGYWSASFTLHQDDLTRSELVNFYNLNLGCRLVETCFGMTAWEGMIVEMTLKQEGSAFGQTMKPTLFHNRVKVFYSDDIGSRAEVAWSENTDSSDIFGESELVLSIAGSTATAATALRDTHLTEFAWPRSREIQGDSYSGEGGRPAPDTLEITAVGHWGNLNQRYRESSETAGASTLITTLVGESEFVTAGRIETNADSTFVDCHPIPQRLGDLIRGIIEQGDNTGAVWQGGVYGGRELVYEEVPTEWTYQKRGSELLDKAGNPVPLALVKPGFLLYNASAPTGWTRPGASSDWDNPQIRYVDQVEFLDGGRGGLDELRLSFPGDDMSMSVLQERIRRGA